MKICPVAIAVGCAKCPVFKICPAKGMIGDFVAPDDKGPAARAASSEGKKPGAKPKKK
jgi:hypothetical protein